MVSTSARKAFPVFDCDSHVVEPPAIWDEYVPARSRSWIKTQFCFHTDSDLLYINGRVVPAVDPDHGAGRRHPSGDLESQPPRGAGDQGDAPAQREAFESRRDLHARRIAAPTVKAEKQGGS